MVSQPFIARISADCTPEIYSAPLPTLQATANSLSLHEEGGNPPDSRYHRHEGNVKQVLRARHAAHTATTPASQFTTTIPTPAIPTRARF